MLRIGEAAKQFEISNRTLRYWEEKGILNSRRTENGYRFYDDENAGRIRQILLLRKLRVPIADIERMILTGDSDVAIDALSRHLTSLRQEANALESLTGWVEALIENLRAKRNLKKALASLEIQPTAACSGQKAALQILLSERNRFMPENMLNDVRMVRIPEMTVASYRAVSETPEKDCMDIVNAFVTSNSLHKKSGFRHFGFNNPSPSAESPVYGYEVWVAVPENFEVPAPFAQKRFTGGLYASIPAKLNEIGERWMQLYEWVKTSSLYTLDESAQWLEECTDFEALLSGDEVSLQLDLLEPVSPKG